MTQNRLFKTGRDRRGAALVEMALVLPVFIAVVLGIVEFGRAMMVSQMVTNAAREGSRLAIIDGSSNSEVTKWIEQFLEDAIAVSSGDVNTTIKISPAAGNDDPGGEIANAQPRDLITITVSVPFDKVSYVPGSYLSGKNLTAQSSMRHE